MYFVHVVLRNNAETLTTREIKMSITENERRTRPSSRRHRKSRRRYSKRNAADESIRSATITRRGKRFAMTSKRKPPFIPAKRHATATITKSITKTERTAFATNEMIGNVEIDNLTFLQALQYMTENGCVKSTTATTQVTALTFSPPK